MQDVPAAMDAFIITSITAQTNKPEKGFVGREMRSFKTRTSHPTHFIHIKWGLKFCSPTFQ